MPRRADAEDEMVDTGVLMRTRLSAFLQMTAGFFAELAAGEMPAWKRRPESSPDKSDAQRLVPHE